MREDLPAPGSAAIFKSRQAQGLAKHLRKSMTDAERALWRALRGLRETGAPFRRQSPFGPYVVDFICNRARLVIEVDGGVHDAQADADRERQLWIETRGYRVLRFSNDAVLHELPSVMCAICAALSDRLPPCGEGGARMRDGWG